MRSLGFEWEFVRPFLRLLCQVRKAVSSNELIQFLAADTTILTYIMHAYNAIDAVYAAYNACL